MCDDEAPEQRESRHVYLSGELDHENATEVIEAITQLSLDSQEPIHLHLVACVGGDAPSGMAVADVIQAAYTAPVTTHAWGEACSIAAIVLAAGVRRTVGRNTQVMVHGYSMSMARPSSMTAAAAVSSYTAMEAAMWQWLDQVTSQELGYWAGRMKEEGEVWLTAHDAVAHGLADVVVEPRR